MNNLAVIVPFSSVTQWRGDYQTVDNTYNCKKKTLDTFAVSLRHTPQKIDSL